MVAEEVERRPQECLRGTPGFEPFWCKGRGRSSDRVTEVGCGC